MTKKQVGIIFTLLGLIVCTALLAGKLNNAGLNEDVDISSVLSEIEDGGENKGQDGEEDEKETASIQDFFYQARSEREQKDALTTENLNNLINNKNTESDRKAEATKTLQNMILKQDKEKSVELNIKNKGYEEVLCSISEDQTKANIILKADELNEEQGAMLQEIVQNTTNIKEVIIELKKVSI